MNLVWTDLVLFHEFFGIQQERGGPVHPFPFLPTFKGLG
jgi:hypothetical protein